MPAGRVNGGQQTQQLVRPDDKQQSATARSREADTNLKKGGLDIVGHLDGRCATPSRLDSPIFDAPARAESQSCGGRNLGESVKLS